MTLPFYLHSLQEIGPSGAIFSVFTLIPVSTLAAYKRAQCLRNLWNSTSLKSLYLSVTDSWKSAIVDNRIVSSVLSPHRGKRQNLVLRRWNLCNLAWSFVFIAVKCEADLKNIIGGVRVALACANNPVFCLFVFSCHMNFMFLNWQKVKVIGALVWGLRTKFKRLEMQLKSCCDYKQYCCYIYIFFLSFSYNYEPNTTYLSRTISAPWGFLSARFRGLPMLLDAVAVLPCSVLGSSC